MLKNKIWDSNNKKGQLGETISWIIATIVIIGVLIIFVYISVLMSKIKTISIGDLGISDSDQKTDLLAKKTSFAHKLTGDRNKDMIDNILKENG